MCYTEEQGCSLHGGQETEGKEGGLGEKKKRCEAGGKNGERKKDWIYSTSIEPCLNLPSPQKNLTSWTPPTSNDAIKLRIISTNQSIV